VPTSVVTDSTANIPVDQASALGIRVVPMTVVIDGHSHEEGVDVSSADLVAALRAGRAVSTAHPGPGVFLAAYRDLAADGADAIVSVHLSARLSGAVNAARLAAAESPVPVTVVDSRSVAMGLGFAVLAGARSARAGGDAATAAAEVERVVSATDVWFCVDDLETLRRGGRVGAAKALVGSALSIKPILSISAGEVVPFDRVRTTARAMARLEELAVERAVLVPSQIAVHHLDALDRAQALADRLRERLPGTEISVTELAAVLSAHSGPGTVAVVVAPESGRA